MSGEMACRPERAPTDSAGPCNCANPATTEARARKADRMDVTLRFSYEAPDKSSGLWGRLLICGRLAIGQPASSAPGSGGRQPPRRLPACPPSPALFPFLLSRSVGDFDLD